MLLLILVCLVVSEAVEMSHEARCPWRMSRDFTLEFKYAAHKGVFLSSSTFAVKWNGKIIRRIIPRDRKVHSIRLRVRANVGSNYIHFIGQGKSDYRGATVDDIKLYRPDSQPGKI